MVLSSAITIAGSQTITEVCFHMVADDRRTFCDLRSAIVCDHMETSLKASFSYVGKIPDNRSGILLFPDHPRFCRLMKTRNGRYPRSSGMCGDKSGESGAFLFSLRVPDFCDGRRSFPTNENSNLYRRGRGRPSAMDFAQYQSPKLLGPSPPITWKHGVSRKSGTDLR